MKKITFLFLLSALFLTGCKKDKVDATNLKSFQASINDMASTLNTLQQIKFSEALYVLKTFGVDADGDTNELKALSKLIEGKKIPEIFALADQVAQKNGIDWHSTGPPSLGEMNIFGNEGPTERDPNDVEAKSLSLITKPVSVDSILGPKALQVIPRLMDLTGNPVNFEGAMLEATMEVFSDGIKLSSAKNIMQDNNFNGFTIRYSSLPKEKILDNKIDVTVSVKTKAKTFKMSKIGILLNPKALLEPSKTENESVNNSDSLTGQLLSDASNPENTIATTAGDPKNVVQKFLNNISTQNLKSAYDASENPAWGSYEKFSNTTSGFGSVKKMNVKHISTSSSSGNSATVNATYDVTDQNGNTTALKVTFGLKNVNGEWKISSYQIK